MELSGLVLDGADHSVGCDRGLIDFSNVGEAEIFDSAIEHSGGFGLRLRACGGSIERNAIRDIAAGGIFTTDATGLVIDDNRVERCGDNGIQVWCSIRGDDGTRVSGTASATSKTFRAGAGNMAMASRCFAPVGWWSRTTRSAAAIFRRCGTTVALA
jgi:hypothetical protein